jgi:predicted amidohydrolase
MRVMTKDIAKIAENEPFMRAFETESFIVMTDAYTNPKATTRLSVICSPKGFIKKIKGKEGMIIADLDKKEIDRLRKNNDLLKY